MTDEADAVALDEIFRPAAVDDLVVRRMVEALDGQDAAPSIQRLRGWSLAAAQLRPGLTVVDVGSGTGTMCRHFAGVVGADGRVVGVEPNPVLRGIAEQRAAEAEAVVEFVDASAADLPFESGSVDVVWCERVLQHVPEAQDAVTEIARVLKPGGRALLIDSDHETRVDSDIDPEVARAIKEAFVAQMANPRAARHIRRQAMAAGLDVAPDIGSSALVFPLELLKDAPLLRASADQAVADGRITRAQADEAIRAHTEAAANGWALSAITVFAFVASKP